MIEAMKQALEALEYPLNTSNQGFDVDMAELLSHRAIAVLRQAIAEAEKQITYTGNGSAGRGADVKPTGLFFQMPKAEKQEPVAWKLVPVKPTEEMLKAMDECSTEGYDERLYAGHAASVYMAAVDVAPSPPAQQEPVAWVLVAHEHLQMTPALSWSKDYNPSIHGGAIPLYASPPQRQWVGLTDEEIEYLDMETSGTVHDFVHAVEAQLKQKNGYAEEKNT
jgi:hypothetical protein